MATTQAGIVLRHLRGLAAPRAGGDVPDGQLLDRFTARHEEAAFAALVRRHGPMVLGVCRRVLGNHHDAEDAFQAAFLILARKAVSISKRDSVGSWLYQVAYHVAMKARERKDRKTSQARAAARSPADPLEEITARELLAAFDEEVQRLPEKYRTPLVLCYLQGQTRDEAARQLGCAESTLHRHLNEARERLRKRMERRGLTLPAALLAASPAALAVPAALAATTVRSALLDAAGKAAAVPAAVAALVRQSLRATAAGKSKAVGAVLLAVSLVAAAAGLAAGRVPDAAGAPSEAAETAKADAPPAEDAPKELAVTGRVLDADGKPAAGATVAVLGLRRSPSVFASGWLESRALARATADADGKFRLALARSAPADYREFYALAGKAGHGLAWARLEPDPSADAVLRLTAEKTLRGRLLDLQGQPAAGVRVRVEWLGTPDAPKAGGAAVGGVSRDEFPGWPGPTTTDKDGRFSLAGVGPDLRGYLLVEGEECAPTLVEVKAGRTQEINLTLSPAQIVEGTVTAEDTGKPVPHAHVQPDTGRGAQADEKGHYRLSLSAGKSYTLSVTGPEGQPYLRRRSRLEWPKGAVKHRLDVSLPRGVVVRGQVSDASTGKPIAGAIVHDAAHLWIHYATTGDDGAFAFAVSPGRGHLLVKGPNNAYVAAEITSGELEGGKRSGYRYYPDALIPFDVKAGADPLDVTAKLRRGVSIRGRVVGPDGKPVAEGVLCCWNQMRADVAMWFGAAAAVHDGQFELRGCDPEATYPVHFLDPRNKLGATARLSAKEAGDKEVTVRLEPCGSAVARFVDKEGNVLTKFRPIFYIVARPGEKGVKADADFVANVDRVNYSGGGTAVDDKGRCSYPVLIPGATYRLLDNNLEPVKEFTVKPGEALDLGDVTIDKGECGGRLPTPKGLDRKAVGRAAHPRHRTRGKCWQGSPGSGD
jgi:RNA polymerase sigma factor (sigma-70 family)